MRRYIQIILSSCALLFTACYSKEPLADTDIEAVQLPLVGITQADHFTPDELCEAMANSKFFNLFGYNGGDQVETSPVMKAIFQMMVNPRLPKMDSLFVAEGHRTLSENQRLWQVESYAFSYKSTSAQGEEITLSGRVTFPNSLDGNGHTVNTLSLCNHVWNTIPETTPSMALSIYPMRIFHNSAVIEPDYEGYGVNDDGHAHPGFSFQVLSVQLKDCLLAARQVMEQRGVTLAADGCSTGWGTSQGAAATIAFSRYYDQEASEAERRLIRLHSSYASEGPINPVETFDYVSRHPDFNATLIHVTAAFLSNLTKEQLGGYDFEEFFPDGWRNRMLTINGITKSYYQFWLANRYTYCHEKHTGGEHKHFAYNFVPEMTIDDGSWDETNPKTKAFVEALHQQSDWGAWIPVTPIYMAHQRQDDLIPYDQAYHLYWQWAQKGGCVFWQDSPIITVDISSIEYLRYHQVASVFDMLRVAFSEWPSEVFSCMQ